MFSVAATAVHICCEAAITTFEWGTNNIRMLSPLSAVKIQIDPNPLFSEEGKGEERRNRKEGRKEAPVVVEQDSYCNALSSPFLRPALPSVPLLVLRAVILS